MRVLITAGSTQTPIDKVRAITNIFKGKTGTDIAYYFADKSHNVTLITSRPEIMEGMLKEDGWPMPNLTVIKYTTFNELMQLMKAEIVNGKYDLIIHSAAVSDYKVDGVFQMNAVNDLSELNSEAKIPSGKELYIKVSPTEKIVDKIKGEWGFTGKLVMFKLQVGMSRNELKRVARASMLRSNADMIVANCLEWANKEAYVIGRTGRPTKVSRNNIGSEIGRRIIIK